MTETKEKIKYSWYNFLFTLASLFFFLLDIVLDIVAVVSFYKEKYYIALGVLLLILVGSSVLVQAFSWLWYSYDNFERHTKVENYPTVQQFKLLHVLQLGIYFRHAGVVEMSIASLRTKTRIRNGPAMNLKHDLSFLRIIETFSESAPQFVLMLTVILHRAKFPLVTVLKALGSASSIAVSVTKYHHSMRAFLPDEKKPPKVSLILYFVWNLLLISSRLTALALFASELPCFIFPHFICSWLVLFFLVIWSKTEMMDSPCGEWLYRATVGLIWYFDWYKLVGGKTRNMTFIYHGYILADISILCSVWCFKLRTEPPYFDISNHYAIIAAVCVVAVYILGLLLKIIFVKWYHPNIAKDDLKGDIPLDIHYGRESERLEVESNSSISSEGNTGLPLRPDPIAHSYVGGGKGGLPRRPGRPHSYMGGGKGVGGAESEGQGDQSVDEEVQGEEDSSDESIEGAGKDTDIECHPRPCPPPPKTQHGNNCNKRMRNLAANFYSS